MNKFLNSVRFSKSNKDEIIKKAIVKQLTQSVKTVQYFSVEENRINKNNDLLDATNTLCTTIEALFLHGVKDSLTYRFQRAISDLQSRPEPHFWSALLVLSHKQLIDQVLNLSLINTEVGQCRAWIRILLNDGLLSSYFLTLRQDTTVLKSFYRPTALLRDSDLLDIAQRLIEGIEVLSVFSLPFNSSLLNTWPLESLVSSGIWVPAMKATHLAPCDDVAQALDDSVKAQPATESNFDKISLCSAMSINSQGSSLRNIVALSEDEILKRILSKPAKSTSSSVQGTDDQKSSTDISDVEPKNVAENVSQSLANQLNRKAGWSFDDENQSTDTDDQVHSNNVPTVTIQIKNGEAKPSAESKCAEASYKAVIDSYNILSAGYIKTPDLKEVWQKFHSELSEQQEHTTENNNQKPDTLNIFIQDTKPNPRDLINYVSKICKENGLDTQNFQCAACKKSLGVTNKPNVCAFTGEYFCDNCMHDEPVSIPARIIHNWDFKPYPVSQRAFDFIEEVKADPLIDFKILNPYIYGAVEQMALLQSLRNQLNFLRAYLYTCKEPVIQELQKRMWPREYLYEHIHQYSISDLYEIQGNELCVTLEKVIHFGREHVTGCFCCGQKGFICEVCNKPKPLFPFDVENVYRCDGCCAVFHQGCLSANKPCPKCKRKKKREELPSSPNTV